MSLHRPSERWRLGLFLSLVTVMTWGTLPIFLKMALEKIDVYTLMWFRFLLSGVLLLGVLGYRRRVPPFHRGSWTSLALLAVATLGLTGNYFYYQKGLVLISPGTAQLLIQSSPLMFMAASLLIFKERLSNLQISGVLGLTVGFVLFFNDHLAEIFAAQNDYALGVFYIFVAAITWAVYALAQKQLLMLYGSLSIMLFLYLGSALIVTPFSTPTRLLELDTWGSLLILYCALNTVIGYGAFAEALAHWDASRVSATLALSPIITLLASSWISTKWPEYLVPESLNMASYAGAALVVVGAMLVALGRQKRSRSVVPSKHKEQESTSRQP